MNVHKKKMKVLVTGLRGIPEIQGGIETHAEHLYPRIQKLGCDVEITIRPAYCSVNDTNSWKGIRLTPIWCPAISAVEAFTHTLFSVLYAGIKRPDIVHIHAIGPALMTPLAKFLGLRVVFTHHGADYDREKWGKFIRAVLRLGERLGVQMSDQTIVISKTIKQNIASLYGKTESNCIPNGVDIKALRASHDKLEQFGIVLGRYILHVGRMVPEKRQLDLIKAFNQAKLKDRKLVLVGKLENTPYTDQVKTLAKQNSSVVLTDFQSGQTLEELYTHAGFFVLPSSHEGLPIALLEARSYGLRCLASDIPSNRNVNLEQTAYFSLGDIDHLSSLIKQLSEENQSEIYRDSTREQIQIDYNWADIAIETEKVYRKIILQ